VTQEQWAAVMGDNPSQFKGRTNPADNVSWFDAQEFIKRLNAREGTNRYRLPTEAEWELAARGGADTRFFFMKDPKTYKEAEPLLDACAWFAKNSGWTTHPVGQKKPNPYGLYDIYGNVFEWVQDWYADKLVVSFTFRGVGIIVAQYGMIAVWYAENFRDFSIRCAKRGHYAKGIALCQNAGHRQ
jgi:formylglycine-generating enzyme required for sulfatase activity